MTTPDPTLIINGKTYRFDRRGGALVQTDTPQHRIAFQDVETHLLGLIATGTMAVKLECLSAAAQFDQILGRPNGSTTKALLEAVNPIGRTPSERSARSQGRER